MTHADDTALAAALADIRYPCRRAQLIEHAAARGAADTVLGALASLLDVDFNSADEVYQALHRTRWEDA